MNRTYSLIAGTTLLLSSSALAAPLQLPRDGWARWTVPAVADAPAWCCYGWNDSSTTTPSCRLDEKSNGYSRRDHQTTADVRIYARMKAGQVEHVRALAANCPVQTTTPIHDLGAVDASDSARWLADLLKSSTRSGDNARSERMAALAIHRDSTAQVALASLARGGESLELRKDAVFWLAHLRGVEGAKVATALMFDDPEPLMRVHSTFAVTQSKSPQIATDLIRLANTDRDTHVRAQAWFWLAHTGAPQTEGAIDAGLRKESEQEVREQAIFALSRLPDERGTKALIAVAENKSLSREDRKKAIFWLAQNDSDAAIAYLDRVVAR